MPATLGSTLPSWRSPLWRAPQPGGWACQMPGTPPNLPLMQSRAVSALAAAEMKRGARAEHMPQAQQLR